MRVGGVEIGEISEGGRGWRLGEIVRVGGVKIGENSEMSGVKIRKIVRMGGSGNRGGGGGEMEIFERNSEGGRYGKSGER